MTDITTPQAPVTERTPEQAAGAKDQAVNVAATAADEAKAVASEAAGEVKDLFADTREQLRSQANEQSNKIAALLGDIGGQLRKMADAGDTGMAKDVIATVADRAESMSSRLGDGGLDRTLADARRVARNRPGFFLAGAALLGFVAARVARTVDTGALKEAVAPSDDQQNATDGYGPSASRSPEPALQPPAPAAPAPAATTPAAPAPVITEPPATSTVTPRVPPMEGPR